MTIYKLFVMFASVLASTNYTVAGDWPEFRGPNAQGFFSGQLPTSWSKQTNIKWRCELPGSGWSSPIVVGKQIFLTAAIPTEASGYQLCLLSVDADSGKLTSNVTVFESAKDAPKIHQKNSHASPTPVFDGQRLYLHFGHQGSACCTLDGQVVWKNSDLFYPPVHGNGGSPVITSELMIFTRDGADISRVTALDKATGRLAWEVERKVNAERSFSFCTPLLIEAAGKKQLIVPGSDVVQSLDPTTGDEIWRVRYSGFSVVPRPVYESGLVFVATGFMQASLLAIDPSGQGDVTDSHLRWSVKSGVPKTASFVANGGLLTMVSDNGVVTCLQSATGKELWKQRIGGDFSTSLLQASQRLYAISETGVCTVMELDPNSPSVVATNDLQERTLASPAVIEQDLLVRTASAIYRISNQAP